MNISLFLPKDLEVGWLQHGSSREGATATSSSTYKGSLYPASLAAGDWKSLQPRIGRGDSATYRKRICAL